MKRLTFYATLFLSGLLLLSLSFAQISSDHFLEERENQFFHFNESLPIQSNNFSTSPKDDDDLLLATRTDDWDINDWVSIDSFQIIVGGKQSTQVLTLVH